MARSEATIACIAALSVALLLSGACDRFEREPLAVPTPAEATAFYEEHSGVANIDLSGNVVEVRVRQPGAQLRRGGTLWAKVGPYITLLSPSTHELLGVYPGVAAVRVITLAPDGEPVGRATLLRGTLSELRWRRTLNIHGHAVQQGTERPTRLEDLVVWGEEHTEHWYSPAYVPE